MKVLYSIIAFVGFLLYALLGVHDILINIIHVMYYPAVLFVVTKSMVYHYGLVLLVPLMFLQRIKNWLFFRWHIWAFVCAVPFSVAAYFLVTGGFDYTPYLPNLAWSNVAVLTWAFLFPTLIFLYQRRGISYVDSFVAAFASVILACWVFEIFNPVIGSLSLYLQQPSIYIALGVFGLLAVRYGVKLDWKFALFAVLPFMVQVSYLLNVNILAWDYVIRLFTFPVFMYFPYLLGGKIMHKFNVSCDSESDCDSDYFNIKSNVGAD